MLINKYIYIYIYPEFASIGSDALIYDDVFKTKQFFMQNKEDENVLSQE